MKMSIRGLGAVFGLFLAGLVTAQLARQSWRAHERNLELRGGLERVRAEARRQEETNRALEEDLRSLRGDPHRMDIELRRGRHLSEGERLLGE